MENKFSFKQLTRDSLKDIFGLKQISKQKLLDDWLLLANQQIINEVDNEIIKRLQNKLIKRCASWNEFELSEWFIGPLISLIDFETDEMSLFAFYEIFATVNGYELSGKPDVMFARGIDVAQMPYFFFHEYKRQTDPNGNPQTQLLGAMLTAQAINNNEKPIYGVYVVGFQWRFIVLNDNKWSESKIFTAEENEIFDIFKILKALKELIINN